MDLSHHQFKALIFTDLDGTLIAGGNPVSAMNAKTIEMLALANIGVIPVSGRNLKMLEKVLPQDLPIDFAICSTGAGIITWPQKELIFRAELNVVEAAEATEILRSFQVNFMVHSCLPENDKCQYSLADGIIPCEDFYRCLERMPEPRKMLPRAWDGGTGASQLLAVFSREEEARSELIAEKLQRSFSVVWSTSPLDHESIWLEIFAKGVKKSAAAKWLQTQIAPEAPCYAIGNDFNDLDLLEWADSSLVMADSPPLLQRSYEVLHTIPEKVLPEAVSHWQLLKTE